jgi:hypothetical protein
MGGAELAAHREIAGTAVCAGEAGDMMMNENAIAYLKTGNAWTDSLDDTGWFMAKGKRRAGRKIPLHGVGNANTTGFRLYQNLTFCWFGYWVLFYSDIVVIVVNRYFHNNSIL